MSYPASWDEFGLNFRCALDATALPARPRSSARRRSGSGFFLGFQDLAALVHAGFQVEVMRTTQFAGILVLDIGRLLDRIRGAAHASPRRRCFSSRNGHYPKSLARVVGGHRPTRTARRLRRGLNADKAALIE